MHCLLLPEHAPRTFLLELVDAWPTPTSTTPQFSDTGEGAIKLRGWMKKMAALHAATSTGTREAHWGVARIFELDADWEHGGLYTRGGEGRAYMDDVKRYAGGIEERREVWVVPVMAYWPERNGGWQGVWEEGEEGSKKVCALVVEEREDGRFDRVGFMWRLWLGDPEEWEGGNEDEGGWFEEGKVRRDIVLM